MQVHPAALSRQTPLAFKEKKSIFNPKAQKPQGFKNSFTICQKMKSMSPAPRNLLLVAESRNMACA
jgi:hypothetical protein